MNTFLVFVKECYVRDVQIKTADGQWSDWEGCMILCHVNADDKSNAILQAALNYGIEEKCLDACMVRT